ncbi:MAG TPA: TonB-dependent receptor [Steroidobacteraceae bacterium]
MSTSYGPSRLPKLQTALSCILLVGSTNFAHADVAEDADQTHAHSLDPVLVTAQALHGPQSAPSQGSLVATQPQSIVGADFIQNNDAPAANYTDIIKFTPSVWTVDPNGPGLMENLGTSIRGFQDGQFNVTFDGIPWGDSNDFTHHSTSYFMAQDIGNLVVDRGPGNAGTLGNATFGGTVYVQSADPKKTQGFDVLASAGSFNTQLYGVRYDTGEVSNWGGLRAFISVKTISSDGYLTNANLERSNLFMKVVQPVNESTDITVAANLNKVRQNPAIGATLNQMAQYGVNYGYNRDPGSQGYYGYNLDKITTDYEYIGIISKVAGWTFDNKIYTYAYFHDGYNGLDVGGSLPNGAIDTGDNPNGTFNANGTANPSNVPGNLLINNYRSVGDIFRVSHDFGPGEVHVGGWFDHQSDIRALYELDMTNNGAFNYDLTPPAGALSQAAYTDRLQHNQLFSRQAYGQYVWHVIQGLDVTAGDKYVNFQRVIVAPVNQGTNLPLDYSKTWTRNLPSVDVHYKLADNWAAYAQYAKGFLAPNLNTLYVPNPSLNQLQPEGTTNIQLGTTWVGSGLTVSADVYQINFSNLIQRQGGGANSFFYNLGGVKYKGAEAEATYIVGAGFSVYGNASSNSAHLTSDNTWVPETPSRTAALGVLYNQNAWQASLIDKYVGTRFGDSGNAFRLSAYSTADAAVNYVVGPLGSTLKNGKIGVTVQNIADHRSIYFQNGYSNANNPLFFTLPGRSFQVNLSASF